MHKLKKITIVSSIILMFSGCSYIDDFAFGKDNAPKPRELPTFTDKKSIVKDWSVDVGAFKKKLSTEDLQPAFDGTHLYIATSKGQLTVLGANNGQIIWQKQTDKTFLAGPVVSGNYLVVTADDAAVYVYDKNNGQELKRILVANDVLAKPLLVSNKLFVKTISGVVSAIDLNTGKKIWSYKHGSPEIILKASSSPVYFNQMIMVGFSDGALVGLDENNGSINFEQQIAYPRGPSDVERLVDVDSQPIFDGDHFYIASYQGEIGAYSISQNNFIWHHKASTYHDLALAGNILFMVSSQDVIWAFDKYNGTVLWKQKGLMARGLSAPVVWNNTLWVADKFGVVIGIDIHTGKFISQHQLKSGIVSAPVIHRDVCWILTTNGQLHRLVLRK